MLEVTFLYFDGCPSHAQALERLRRVLAEVGVQADVEIVRVETDEQAERWRFVGSPTIRINGEDIAPTPPEGPYRLACRTFVTEDGRLSPLPSEATIRRAVQRALSGGPGTVGEQPHEGPGRSHRR
ncbi:MAG: DUF2703 domain-containing protein [Armatimonadota bacterium]|nr:DUF2703 domain-containing protein [Armatimonadota bacterium]MDR5697420.1 DUF2703 domain-containing protein [Armatimonadota bacterium]